MQQRTTFYRQYGKRLFDLVVAVPLLIVLTPLMLITALAIRFSLGRPILFRQPRPGREGRLFEMIKFRTMREAYDTQNNSLPDSARLTKLGKWLRATSIDELPELWNVIRGEMSIVGPRPLLVEYLSLYTADQMRRHDMIPGLTGWSQIHGRNDLGWGEKFEHDLWYVNNCNFVLDLKILAITIGKVLSRHGVSQIGHATTEKFNGENQLSLHLRDSEKRVTVLGAGGHAKVVVSMLRALGYEIAGIYDDAPELLGIQIYGIEVRDRISALPTNDTGLAIAAIGDSITRQSIIEQFDFTWLTLIHPSAYIDETASLGAGTVVMAGAIVQPGSRIGRHAIINTAASVDHDCTIEDFVHICPGAHLAGTVSVGERTLLGTGCSVIPGIHIGANVIVGAGAVVTKDLPDGVTVVGLPAKVIKHHCNQIQAA